MTTPLKDNIPPNPHWVTFWGRIRAAAEELRQIEQLRDADRLKSLT